MVIDRLTLQEIQRVCESMPVKSMNLEEGNLWQDFHNDRLGIRCPTLGPGDVQRITEQALMRPAPQCSPPREILFQLPSCT